jgi:hypothetical protein
MSVTYCYDPDRNRIETTCAGDVQFVEVLNHFHLLDTDAKVRPAADVLLDLRTVTSMPGALELETMNEALVRIASRRPMRRCAVLVCDEASRDIATRFSTMAAPQFTAVRVFADRAEGTAWLDSATATAAL